MKQPHRLSCIAKNCDWSRKMQKWTLGISINPLTPGDFAKNAFYGHSGGFQVGSQPNSINLVENAFATRQLALLVTSIAFYDILARACAEIKIFILDKKVT